jgi:hypothetical protein
LERGWGREALAPQRVSRLPKQRLRWLRTDHQRTRGVLARVSFGAFVDTDFGEVSVTLITPVGIRLQHDVIISKLDLA